MGNKPTTHGGQHNPERSLSWQPPEPSLSPGYNHQRQSMAPGRRNSFATAPPSAAPPGGGGGPAVLVPRHHYAASEMGGARYQKRPNMPSDNSKLSNKANSLKNKQIQQYYGSSATMSRGGGFEPPPPPHLFPPYYGPPLPPAGPVPFMYGPPQVFHGPPPPPMDPAFMMMGPPPNDSNRMKKIKQKQQKQFNAGRHYATMGTLSEMPPPPPMFAIMPPPPQSVLGHPHAYQPAIYRAKSMDNINGHARERSLKLYSENKKFNKDGGEALGKDGHHRSHSQLDVPTGVRNGNLHSRRHGDADVDDEQYRDNGAKSVRNTSKIELDRLHPIEDGLTPDNEQSKPISDKLHRANDKSHSNNSVGKKLTSKQDVIYESLKGAEQNRSKAIGKRGSATDVNPTAVNIRFDNKEKIEKFVPPIATVTPEAQTVMERNAKHLADAEQIESQKPGSVTVNDEIGVHNYEDENGVNEQLQHYVSSLPPRKLEAELFEQRTLQRPVQRLNREPELPELKLPTPTVCTRKPLLGNDSPASSSKSSVSKSCLKKTKAAQNFPQNPEDRLIDPVFNPILVSQQKSNKRSVDEFRPSDAWSEIDVSSEAYHRRCRQNGGVPSARWQQGNIGAGSVDERILVHLLPLPPSKRNNANQQEQIYLDNNKDDKRLPDFKKRLIETGSFDFAEMDNHNYHHQRHQQSSSKASSIVGDDKIQYQQQTLKDRKSSDTSKHNGVNNWNRVNNYWTDEENVNNNIERNRRQQQKYTPDNRSKSNLDQEMSHRRAARMTPSETNIKAGDCSDIDFSWVDDLEFKFRTEREQFERELQSIKEKTLQNNIRCLHADETVRANNGGAYLRANFIDDLLLSNEKDRVLLLGTEQLQHHQKQQRNNSLSTDEPSSLMDSSLTNSPKDNNSKYQQTQNIGDNKFVAVTTPFDIQHRSRFESDLEPRSYATRSDGSNFLREYSGPSSNANGVNNKPSSYMPEDVDRMVSNNYVKSRAATFENEFHKQQIANHLPLHSKSFNTQPVEDNIDNEPIYIPKPDYEQMENDVPTIGSPYQHDTVATRPYQNGSAFIQNIPQSKQHASSVVSQFDRSLTVQTNQNHENTTRAYPSPSPRSPSQRKLNRYYANSQQSNGFGHNTMNNNVSFESDWVEESVPVLQSRKDRYNVQLGGSYSVNPNITTDFKQFDLRDSSFPQYNGKQSQQQNYGRQDASYQDYHQDQKFVEKMNEMNGGGGKGDNQKWFRNPTKQQLQNTNFGRDNSDAHSDMYISRPNLVNNGRYNFSRSQQMYGSSHY